LVHWADKCGFDFAAALDRAIPILYTPDRGSSLSHLKTTYHKYLADLFAANGEEPPIPDGE
jgi:hypothetical protein